MADDKSLENGYDDLLIEVTKTVQEFEFEPLKVRVALTRRVLPTEVSSTFRQVTEQLEEEICTFMGLDEVEEK